MGSRHGISVSEIARSISFGISAVGPVAVARADRDRHRSAVSIWVVISESRQAYEFARLAMRPGDDM